MGRADSFGTVLRLHAARHGETIYHLYNALDRPGRRCLSQHTDNMGQGREGAAADNQPEDTAMD